MAFFAGQKLKQGNLGQLSSTAQYQGAATQSIPNGTDTAVLYGTDNFTTSLVTKSTEGAGHKFTFNASGIASVTTTLEFATNGTGERAAHLEDSLGIWHCADNSGASGSFPIVLHMGITKYFAAGDWIKAEVYQTSGGALNLEVSALQALGRIDIAFLLVEG